MSAQASLDTLIAELRGAIGTLNLDDHAPLNTTLISLRALDALELARSQRDTAARAAHYQVDFDAAGPTADDRIADLDAQLAAALKGDK